jgi:transcriptional regulator with XRE-family HTH domain
MNLVPLAQRIRSRRTELGLTLEQVATQTGLTRGFLSKVENFRTTPSLPSLMQISKALGMTLSQLVEGLDERPNLVVVRRDERKLVTRDDTSSIAYYALAHKRPGKAMDAFLLEIAPKQGRREMLAHEGEEFLMLLEGTLDYRYGDDQYLFHAGDCWYDDGCVPHALTNPGDVPARVLVVYSSMHEPEL